MQEALPAAPPGAPPGPSPSSPQARKELLVGRRRRGAVRPRGLLAALCPHSLHRDAKLHGVLRLRHAGPHRQHEEVGAENPQLGAAQLVQGVPEGRRRPDKQPNSTATPLTPSPPPTPPSLLTPPSCRPPPWPPPGPEVLRSQSGVQRGDGHRWRPLLERRSDVRVGFGGYPAVVRWRSSQGCPLQPQWGSFTSPARGGGSCGKGAPLTIKS